MGIAIVTRSAEVKLIEMLNSMQNPQGWQAVHFHLSQLLEQYKSEYQAKIAINLINDLLKNYDGGIFLMQDQSIAVLCSRLEKTVLNKLIFQLRYLYMDDPLAYTDEGHENPDFCTAYDLGSDWQAFFDVCTRRMMATSSRRPMAQPAPSAPAPRLADPMPPRQPVLERAAPAAAAAPAPVPVMAAPAPVPPVAAVVPAAAAKSEARPDVRADASIMSRLAVVEHDLQRIDLSKALRRQPVCTAASNMAVRKVFDEIYIHIAHLRQVMKTEVDFLSNRWLFKYLTGILDGRMMSLIRENPQQYINTPISLNVNVETLLSSSFEQFNAVVKPEMRVSVVFEVPVVDVFADMAAFMLARRELQKMGYRLCLDGLTIQSFLNIDRAKLGADLLKVQWNADVQGDLQSKENMDLKKAVADSGSNRVILCRCDNRQAVEYGQALGISLFQGRYLDSLINPQAELAN